MSIGHLTLRLAVIGGQTAPDDYSVLEDCTVIGRIMRATERKGEVWTWSVTVHIPGVANGCASSLDQAKADFRASWSAVKATVDPDGWRKPSRLPPLHATDTEIDEAGSPRLVAAIR